MSSSILKIKNVTVAYSEKFNILENVNLSLSTGEIIALIGENGAGKSTLLKSICGLMASYKGEVEIFEENLRTCNKSGLAQRLAYVSSSEDVRSIITVKRFIGFGRYPHSGWMLKPSERDFQMIDEALKTCGIEYLASKTMAQLSDGERQKVYLARAIAQNAELIILDEPTTHLDIKSSNSIFNLIKSQREQGRAVLFSSHQVDKALKIADKVWLVDCGRVIETTPTEFNKNERLKKLIFGEI